MKIKLKDMATITNNLNKANIFDADLKFDFVWNRGEPRIVRIECRTDGKVFILYPNGTIMNNVPQLDCG
jgi:hypothetical protein